MKTTINKTVTTEEKAIRIGTAVEIKKCLTMPEMVGEKGVIVDMQIQPFEKYTVYPVWVKITTGKKEGKIYGFHYDELDVLAKALKEDKVKTKLADQLEEILNNAAILEDKQANTALRIGSTVDIKKCIPMPEVVGNQGEVVDMQIQPFDKYTVYPVWIKMINGKHEGKIFGFQYDEIEVHVPSPAGEITRAKVVEHLEEFLKTMRVGATVKIKKCDAMPDIVGENGEIAVMQTQSFEKYTTYPLWVKITTGKRQGKVYGFHYDEIEVMPREYRIIAAKTELTDQLEKILKGITTLEDVAEIERLIGEAKGNIMVEKPAGFWEDKLPCWEMVSCPKEIKENCPAFKNQGLACCQIEGTYCKLTDDANSGRNTDICRVCRVYKRWGQDKPIDLKLFGKGFNTLAKEVVI